jgi:hypothetical protein
MVETGLQRELVDIVGVCEDPTSWNLNLYPYWKQLSVMETMTIPKQKPDIEQLEALKITAEIKKTKVIVTPESVTTGENPVALPNEEGMIVTGRKLVVEGLLCETVTYLAEVADQSLHSAHFVTPFSAYIVIPKELTVNGVLEDTLDINFDVLVCIEDVFLESICKRQIFKNTTLLLQAVPVSKKNCLENC